MICYILGCYYIFTSYNHSMFLLFCRRRPNVGTQKVIHTCISLYMYIYSTQYSTYVVVQLRLYRILIYHSILSYTMLSYLLQESKKLSPPPTSGSPQAKAKRRKKHRRHTDQPGGRNLGVGISFWLLVHVVPVSCILYSCMLFIHIMHLFMYVYVCVLGCWKRVLGPTVPSRSLASSSILL